jgi:hypothetical protein
VQCPQRSMVIIFRLMKRWTRDDQYIRKPDLVCSLSGFGPTILPLVALLLTLLDTLGKITIALCIGFAEGDSECHETRNSSNCQYNLRQYPPLHSALHHQTVEKLPGIFENSASKRRGSGSSANASVSMHLRHSGYTQFTGIRRLESGTHSL